MAVEGELTMSRKERDRLKVVEAVREKRLKQGEAAQQLGLSVRQVKRLVRAHREEGAAGLVSQRRGQPSNRRIEDAEREEVMACVRSRYGDFGPTLAAEYLRSFHGFTRSTETLRQWMIEACLRMISRTELMIFGSFMASVFVRSCLQSARYRPHPNSCPTGPR